MTSLINDRISDHPIDSLFLERWSPRAFQPVPISHEQLMTLFEAARWAPSSYNAQPWRFIYAHRDTAQWERLLGLLNEVNRTWARDCSVLILILSKTTMLVPGAEQETPAYNHAFDTGAAWASLALQATRSGLHTHCIAGLDRERAITELSIPAGYRVEAAVAVGRIGTREALPEALRAREIPSHRQPVVTFAFEGMFGQECDASTVRGALI